MDYYQILGIRRNCDRDTLHKAFRELSRSQHPDRFDEAVRPDAEKKYQRIVIAFNTLKDPKQRAKYDKSLAAPQRPKQDTSGDPAATAKKYFQTGMTRYQGGDYMGAVEAFKRAVHYRDDSEYYYYKAMAESRLPRLRKEAVVSMQHAINKNPRVSKYHIQMIRLFVEFGLTARARATVDKAVSLFPGDEELLTLAQEVNPEKFKKSIFGGLFGKKKGG